MWGMDKTYYSYRVATSRLKIWNHIEMYKRKVKSHLKLIFQLSSKTLKKGNCVFWLFKTYSTLLKIIFGSGAINGKTLIVGFIENNKIDA